MTAPDPNAPPRAQQHRLPPERVSLTHKFGIAGHEGYLTVGMYPNGQPGEVFIRMAKEGSTISGLMDSFAVVLSVALQHGVPLNTICEKLAHTRFEPSGFTGNEVVPYAKSISDYIGQWLQKRFVSGEQIPLFTLPQPAPASPQAVAADGDLFSTGDAPTCATCGSLCQRTGTCWRCSSCGTGLGGCS